MDRELLKRALNRVEGNTFFTFLFFLLVSCSLWLSLTLNRVYETNVPVLVYVKNLPAGLSLEGGNVINSSARLKGEGTALFGYIFGGEISVSVDYSDFSRNGGRLLLSSARLREKVLAGVAPSLSLQNFAGEMLVANVKRVSATLPVVVDVAGLNVADGCKLLSVSIEPQVVDVEAFVDELPDIKSVQAGELVCQPLSCDTVIELPLMKGNCLSVEPSVVQLCAKVSRYVCKSVEVPVEYVGFSNLAGNDSLPKVVSLSCEVLEVDRGSVSPIDFSVRLSYESYRAACEQGKNFVPFVVCSSSSSVKKIAISPQGVSPNVLQTRVQ